MFRMKVHLLFLILFFVPLQFIDAGVNLPENVNQVLISERIILKTDRRVYIAGENLLYNLYLVDTRKNQIANYPSVGYVMISNTKGEILGKSQVKINQGKATGAIYLSDTLQSGYYQVVAYTNFMRNGSPEQYSKHQVLIANRFDKDFFGLLAQQSNDSIAEAQSVTEQEGRKMPVGILMDKTTFGKREKVSFKITVQEKEMKFLDFMVVVTEKNRIEEHLMNHSKNARVSKAITFDASGNGESPVHFAEDKFTELLGRVTDANHHEPLAYNVLYLSTPDTVNNFKYTTTNARGYFRFPLSDYYNGKDIFIKLKAREGESLTPKIVIDSKFETVPFSVNPWPVDSSIIKYLKNSQNIVRIQKSFSLIQSQYQPQPKKSVAPLLFNVPDYSVAPADFVELKDFIEISREIVPPLKIRKRDQIYTAEILDFQQRLFLPPRPVIFLDGVLLDDISQVVPYGTKDIKRVDVISSKWIIDHQVLDGVLSIHSHNNLWKNIALNNFNLKMKAENYYKLPNFYQPNYSLTDVKSREPDFRQLLYWNSGFQITAGNGGMVNFYTSDYAGTYIIKVSGISENGELVEACGELVVTD